MGDSQKAINSQGVVQGDESSVKVNKSNISIGSTLNERQSKVGSIKDFEEFLRSSQVDTDIKAKVLRHMEKARYELENEEEPDPSEVEKWLKRAKTTLGTVAAGSEIYEKMRDLFRVFDGGDGGINI